MKPSNLRLAGGSYVVGEKFWDRETELALLAERLDDGAHLLLVAPRRIGKTSLMMEATRRLGDRYLCLYIDLQKSDSAADAIVALSLAVHPHKPLWQRATAMFRNLAPDVNSIHINQLTVTLRSSVTEGDWDVKGDRLLEILAAHDMPVVLFLDEVPILVNRLLKGNDYRITPERRQAADAFLSWLRSATIRHQGQLRFVLAGSIGLEPIVRQAGLSATLNTLAPFPLEPWNRDAAMGCLRALTSGYGLDLSEEAMEAMLERLGVWIPHHVQMFFENVYEEARHRKVNKVDSALVDEVYRHRMLSVRGHVELSHLEDRLRMVLGPELDTLALELLTEAAVVGILAPRAAETLALDVCGDRWRAALTEVLGILEHDGYLSPRERGYVFVSKLVGDWWKARFGFSYVKAFDRRS